MEQHRPALRIGFHASHEQFAPSALLAAAQAAASSGWDAVMCSDHLHGWSRDHLHASAFAWSWLGACMQSVPLTAGVVCAPGQRYHPVIVAQAAATLASMYPERLWVALGSGERLNEHVTGDPWPDRAGRRQRLAECVEVIRQLWRGEEVTHSSEHLQVDRARVDLNGAQPPRVRGACLSPSSAAAAAAWADGMITVNGPTDDMRATIDAYRDAGGRGPIAVQVHLAWAGSDQQALELAHRAWRFAALEPDELSDLATPEQFDHAAQDVSPAQLADRVIARASLRDHVDALGEILDLGVDELHLHHVGADQLAFVQAFGDAVLPRLRAHALSR